MDAASLLSQIEAAIEALLTGGAESYSIGNRSVTKLDLNSLLAERRALLTEVANASGSGGMRLAKMGRRS